MTFADLEAWKEARLLVKMVYNCLALFPKEEIYGLQSQIKRSVISIPSNIAEGCGRSQPKDTMRFFFIARGSAYELETQLYLSFDLEFIDETTLKLLLDKLTRIRILLAGLIKYQTSQIIN
ncbi:four helix bundle protein [Mucilaginibacter glaciei]|uniref:Four helix bundle protein n=1 Tax=Mucilaginibacter glaciei TaxID=2772109 RepID=A0A926S0E8_9SPHI|nr:four helix bundle protein [Mucilaginibacter glaciei]MBD1392875.1 four helix bundle protein [Mucilaginibacter glaciei]